MAKKTKKKSKAKSTLKKRKGGLVKKKTQPSFAYVFENVTAGYSNIFSYGSYEGESTETYSIDVGLDDEQFAEFATSVKQELGKEGLKLLKKKVKSYEKNKKDEKNLHELTFLPARKYKWPINLFLKNGEKIDKEDYAQGYLKLGADVSVYVNVSIFKGEVGEGKNKKYVEVLTIRPAEILIQDEEDLKASKGGSSAILALKDAEEEEDDEEEEDEEDTEDEEEDDEDEDEDEEEAEEDDEEEEEDTVSLDQFTKDLENDLKKKKKKKKKK